MLSTTTYLVTFVTFVLEMCTSSPIYNMQPAFITTHIGSTGRNIRHLPCISRKSNQRGVCMFAIDCLKANGTHLGTCIDRFYFGSCCHVDDPAVPVGEIIDNNIDSINDDILPSRAPPHRITLTSTPSSFSPSTSLRPSSSSSTAGLESKVTTTMHIAEDRFTSNPQKNKSTTQASSVEDTTTITYKLSTFQSVNGISTTLSPVVSSTDGYKTTSTKISVQTSQSEKVSQGGTITRKPVTKPTRRPPLKSTVKPKTTTKPQTSSTPKTTTERIRPSQKPSKGSSTQRTTTERIRPSQKPFTQKVKPTLRPSSVKPTRKTPKPVRTTAKTTTKRTPTTITVTKSTTTTAIRDSTIKPATKSTTSLPVTTSSINKVPLISSNLGTNSTTGLNVSSGDVETNEIIDSPLPTQGVVSSSPSTTSVTVSNIFTKAPSSTTNKDSFVTWTMPDASTSEVTEEPSEPSSSEGSWVPLTTPDGWVLLPTVAMTTTSPQIPNETVYTNSSSGESTLEPLNKNATTPIPPIVSVSNATSGLGAASSTYSPETISTSSSTVGIRNVTTTATPSSTLPFDLPAGVDLSTSSSIGTPYPFEFSTHKPVNMSDYTDVCGRRMVPEARIVGGGKALYGRWPWQISLRQWRTSTYLHKCGAALLNENWAITAAHCVDSVPPSDLLLRLGEHDLSTDAEPHVHQERRVQIVASHPQFDPRTFEYDLALLRFYEPINFQPNIIPICVPQNDDNFVGRTAYVTGWGRLYEDGPLPSVLQEVQVPVINNTVCESMYRSAGYIEHIPNIFICAGWRRGGFDSCEGDSGGPLVIERSGDKRFELAGVISWGIGCAEPNQPGVYTRISQFRDWINQILQF